jgi:hypothetical protein
MLFKKIFMKILEGDVVNVVDVAKVDDHEVLHGAYHRNFRLLFMRFVNLDFVLFGTLDHRLDLFGLALHFRQYINEFLSLRIFSMSTAA